MKNWLNDAYCLLKKYLRQGAGYTCPILRTNRRTIPCTFLGLRISFKHQLKLLVNTYQENSLKNLIANHIAQEIVHRIAVDSCTKSPV
jgi:hypothetical protein